MRRRLQRTPRDYDNRNYDRTRDRCAYEYWLVHATATATMALLLFAASLAVTQIGCQDAAEGHWQQGWQGVRNTKRARADHCTPRLGGQSTARGSFAPRQNNRPPRG